ncbi:MAG: efflux RND transporter periplasmic adaptor subunit [Halofilum sp. (in: g-proteobacteria)]|nr:efflux RND transporter periplasmic adaptor subunit [Halofilum sp. (in: g-proteobacteria)]
MTLPRPVTRTLAILAPLLAGAAIAAWLIADRPPAATDDSAERARAVAVIEAPAIAWVPRATGYGEARPARTWRATAEVAGRVVERHAELASGAILPAGTRLLQIDRADYELALAEARAAISARRAQLDELETREENLQRTLEIERRRLEVAQRELERQQRLLDEGTVSRADVDRQQREYLQQRQAVQEIESSLAQIPAERRRLQAELERDRARETQAERDLPRTVVHAPFDIRVSAVDTETGEYVRVGDVLLRADGVAATEVEAEVPVSQFRAILDPARLPADADPVRLERLLPRMGLRAEVRLRATGGTEPMARWSARVDRISDAIDPRTRTVGVVTVVDDPYANARPPERPPLVKGMYVEVRLCAPARQPAVVIPRAALHGGRVYVAGPDDRLAIRAVDVGYRHGGFAVIADGLAAGERVVVSDPVPAIAGMLLAPSTDAETAAALATEARGTAACP